MARGNQRPLNTAKLLNKKTMALLRAVTLAALQTVDLLSIRVTMNIKVVTNLIDMFEIHMNIGREPLVDRNNKSICSSSF